MNREEAIEVIKKKMYDEADGVTIENFDGNKLTCTINIDLEMKEAIKVLENAEKTVDEILDWKEGDIYKWRNMKYKLEKGVLYTSHNGEDWRISTYNDLNNNRKMAKIIKKEAVKEKTVADILGWEEGQVYKICGSQARYKIQSGILMFQFGNGDWVRSPYNNRDNTFEEDLNKLNEEVVKEEPKLKAWRVTDEYSFNCLMKELIEKGYTKTLGGFLTIKTSYYSPVREKTRNYIYLHDNDSISFSHELVRDGYDIIEYHKEEPKFYAKIKGWELTNDGDCYWYKDENPIHGICIYPWSREEASIYTKEEWAKLGITEENADFERIE